MIKTEQESFDLLERQVKLAFDHHRLRLERLRKKMSQPAPAKSKERYMRALEMRRSGKLLREIAAEFGVSVSRARGMVKYAEKIVRARGSNG